MKRERKLTKLTTFTLGNAASSNQPTSAPTYELLKNDSDSMGSPTTNVPETKTPSASPTIDPCSDNICTWTQIGRPLTGDNYGDGAGTSTAISEDGKILAVGGAGSGETGGFAKIFVRRGFREVRPSRDQTSTIDLVCRYPYLLMATLLLLEEMVGMETE